MKRVEQSKIEVPCELVEEILARVPVKELLRFRCVCKRWRSLIEDKGFIRKQFAHSPQKLLSCARGNPSTPRFCLYEYNPPGKAKRRMLDNRRVLLVFHSSGLICLCFSDKSLAVWNPALRQLREIQPTTVKSPVLNMMGFGCDHSSNDYKIVLLSYRRSPKIQNPDYGRVEVISLKTGSRVIDHPSFAFGYPTDPVGGTLFGNHIFWVFEDPTSKVNFISSFDLAAETFNRLSCPLPNARINELNLLVIRGHLCVREYRWNEVCIWSGQWGKERSEVRSWSKLFTVSIDDIKVLKEPWSFDFHIVECETEALEMLVNLMNFEGGWESKVVRLSGFNTKENVFTKFEIDSSSDDVFIGPYAYKESLLSVYG